MLKGDPPSKDGSNHVSSLRGRLYRMSNRESRRSPWRRRRRRRRIEGFLLRMVLAGGRERRERLSGPSAGSGVERGREGAERTKHGAFSSYF